MFTRYRLLFGIMLCLLSAARGEAMSIAVFPFEDLSDSPNGINTLIVDTAAERLADKNIDVITGQRVISFMARHRVRWLGILDTASILLAKEELGADYILLGTVYQSRQRKTQALGVTVFLVRTDDSRIVWSNTAGICHADMIRILGLAQPDPSEDLTNTLVGNVLESWPGQLDTVKRRNPYIEIDKVTLSPKFVRPGERIKCKVSLRSLEGVEKPSKIYVKAGSRVHVAMESPDGRYYEASWVGSDGGRGAGHEISGNINLAMQSLEQFSYESEWTGSLTDGRYPVTLALHWPSGRKTVNFLGTYSVDSRPPKVDLQLKGISVDNRVAFRDQVVVIPRMEEREPITRWRITVANEQADEILREDGNGKMPRRFFWRGTRGNGRPALPGVYAISFTTWDRAGNMSVASRQVMMARQLPPLALTARQQDDTVTVGVRYEGDIPISFWRMEMRSQEGALLKALDGDQLPVQVDVPASEAGGGKIECIVLLRDILGNQIKKEVKDLQQFADRTSPEEAEEEAVPATDVWIEEF